MRQCSVKLGQCPIPFDLPQELADIEQDGHRATGDDSRESPTDKPDNAPNRSPFLVEHIGASECHAHGCYLIQLANNYGPHRFIFRSLSDYELLP